MRLAAAASLVALAGVAVFQASGTGARDATRSTSFLLRADRGLQRIGDLTIRRTGPSRATYQAAINAFGEASACRPVNRNPAHVKAKWISLGVALVLRTYGGLPSGETGCSAPELIKIDTVTVTGQRWRTSRGLRVGDPARRVRELYPRALFRRSGYLSRSWWLVAFRERCFVGVCPSRYVTAPRLVAKMASGRVRAFFFPVGAQGE